VGINFQERYALPASWRTETDAALADSVARWAETEVMARRTELVEDRAKLLLPAARSLLDELGLRELLAGDDLPEGAAGTTAVVLEQVGRADGGIALGLAGTYALQAAARVHGKPKVAAALADGDTAPWGSLVLPGFGQDDPGFDGLGAQVVATRKGRGWALDGRGVRPQFGGRDADWFAVFATLQDGEPGVLLVPGGAEGLRRGKRIKTTGLAFSRAADLTLRGVKVSDAMVLCRGEAACQGLVAWARLGSAATAVGGALAAHEILDDWADNRVIKGRGQPFKRNALVAALLGEIGGHIGTARLQLHALAQLIDGGAAGAALDAASIAVSRAVIASSLEVLDRGMELMASAGYATEWNLERHWRDVRTLQSLQGPSSQAQTAIARHHFGTEIRGEEATR